MGKKRRGWNLQILNCDGGVFVGRGSGQGGGFGCLSCQFFQISQQSSDKLGSFLFLPFLRTAT